jgi:ABC-type sugar transport system ATPase subunit
VAAWPEAAPRLFDLDFCVRKGEIVGVAGLAGAGRTELLRHLIGAWGHRLRGEVLLRGAPIPRREPHESLSMGVALVPDDRKQVGLLLEQSVLFNLTLSSLALRLRHGLIDEAREREVAERSSQELGIKAASLHSPTRELSGGNQQKVLIARALLAEPELLLLDEPTRGVDVAAKAEIAALITRLAAQGKAVLLISNELSELTQLCHRVLVMKAGRLTGEFLRGGAQPYELLAAALGAQAASKQAPTSAIGSAALEEHAP